MSLAVKLQKPIMRPNQGRIMCYYRPIVHGVQIPMTLFEFTCLCATLPHFEDLYFTQIFRVLKYLRSEIKKGYHYVTLFRLSTLQRILPIPKSEVYFGTKERSKVVSFDAICQVFETLKVYHPQYISTSLSCSRYKSFKEHYKFYKDGTNVDSSNSIQLLSDTAVEDSDSEDELASIASITDNQIEAIATSYFQNLDTSLELVWERGVIDNPIEILFDEREIPCKLGAGNILTCNAPFFSLFVTA